ncbi:MAG: hypothetical protein JXR84_03965 [Anaerolineae bacterium]|nr:hypothetical protein [Anaerolineae bacterium]
MHPLNLIWQQAQTGDRLGARKELARRLREQPDDVQAWLLMAALLDEPEQQAECCRKVLHLDPQNRHAAAMLQRIGFQGNVPEAPLPSRPSVRIPELFDYTNEGVADDERLTALIREDLVKYVARELGSGADRNALIRHVCETGEMSWPEAEAFVARVALEHEHEIAKRQSPLMLALSVATLIGGVILTLAGGYTLISFFSGELQARLDFAYYGLVTGLAMVAGGLIGLTRTLKSLRETQD